jgi:hypothetical protein
VKKKPASMRAFFLRFMGYTGAPLSGYFFLPYRHKLCRLGAASVVPFFLKDTKETNKAVEKQ